MAIKNIKTQLCLTFFLLCTTLFSGCSLSYLFHAAAGQIRIMSRSVPLDVALEDPSLKPEEKERLLLVRRIKDFGERELGLTPTDNYETVYLERETTPVYTVTAAHKTRLEPVTWWFPVVGRMPYLGYFNPDAAQERKRKLEEKGLDVVIWPALAYSTLGWFQDPVHRNLLRKDPLELTDTILHEMTHVSLYVKGQPAFNESLAVAVGRLGTLAFAEKNYGKESIKADKARAMIRDERRFSLFIEDLLSRLTSLYNGPLSEEEKLDLREIVFDEAVERFRGLESEFETDRFRGFGSRGLNNAHIISVAIYHAHFHLFEAVIKARGGSISESLEVFRSMSEMEGDLINRIEEWLL